ncbi:hypothetical protein [Maribacter sp. 2-571]|uniref:hypothetical protein n=1 Tax=Maribacter sp. 2-571 TaxID=3417569 RepID=UPI003D34FBC0
MGYAGQPMKSVKANRALLKKRKRKNIQELLLENGDTTEVDFKTFTAEQVARAKARIRAKARRNRLFNYLFYAFCLFLVLWSFYWMFSPGIF